MFNVAELHAWEESKKIPVSFDKLFVESEMRDNYDAVRHFVSYEILSDTIAWSLVPEDTSPDDARLQLKAAHDTAEPQNPVSRLRDLLMVRYDRQLLCAVYDGELNVYDTLTYMKTDVTAGRLRYEAQPESYLLAAIQAGSATATAPVSQRPSLKSIDFITLADALNFVAGTIDVPTGRATAEDESMWRASEAAGVLHEHLSNASGNRPRWV